MKLVRYDMQFFRILHLPLKPVGFRFHAPMRGTCYTLSPLWIEHGAEQAEAQDNLVTWQRRANTTVILVFFKGFCWGSTFQWSPIVPSIDSDWSVCLYWAALNQAGWDHPKLFLGSDLSRWQLFVKVTQAGWAQVCNVSHMFAQWSYVFFQPCTLSSCPDSSKHRRRKTLRLNIRLVES